MYNMMGGQLPQSPYNMGIPQGGGFDIYSNPILQTPGGFMNMNQPKPLLGANAMQGLAGMFGQKLLQSQQQAPQAVPPIPQRPWIGWQASPWIKQYMSLSSMGGR